MPKPQKVELESLDHAGELLKFAAENAKEIDEKVLSAISLSWEARDNDQWNAAASAKFWAAYHSLCVIIKPASLDTLQSNTPTLIQRKWKIFGRSTQTSLSKNTARNYLNLMLLGLFVAISIQLIVSTSANLVDDVEKILVESDKIAENIAQEITALENIPNKTPVDEKKVITSINNKFQQIWSMEDKIVAKLEALSRRSTEGDYDPNKTIDEAKENLKEYWEFRRDSIYTTTKLSSVVKILSSTLLPLLFGFVGACAYVTRLVSEQIKDSSFSSTSPTRHRVRVALGALAGVIVGFGWIGGGTSASASALAFIAGYAIEPVFATVDSIAEKFRK